MSLSRSQLGWFGGSGLLLAGLLYVAFNWLEVVDQAEWVGAEGAALSDPYFAMQRLLPAMGADVVAIKRFAEIDSMPADAVLILGDRRLAMMSTTRVARLVAWVRSGGKLLIEAEQPRLDDPLLAAFGVSHIGLRLTARGLRERRDPPAGKGAAEGDEEPGIDAESLPDGNGLPAASGNPLLRLIGDREISLVKFDGGAQFQVMFAPYQNLRLIGAARPGLAVHDKTGLRLLQFSEGKGRVTAISNFDFMVGRSLDKLDHAEFLWHLVAGQGENGLPVAVPLRRKVVLALRDPEQGLMKWLAANAWMALSALLALLLAWMARISRRFGPLQPAPPMARRSLAEHLVAMGRFIGRHRGWEPLLAAARERFKARLFPLRPAMAGLDPARLAIVLGEITGMGTARIQRALFLQANSGREFGEAIRTLRALEQILQSSSSGRSAGRSLAPRASPSTKQDIA